MSKPRQKATAPVTGGVDTDNDLRLGDEPTSEMSNALDEAMDAAGLSDVELAPNNAPLDPIDEPAAEGDLPPEQAVAPTTEEPAGEEGIPEEKPTDPVEPAAPSEPSEPQQTPEEIEAGRVAELESLDLDAITPPPGVSPRNLVNFDKLREVAKLHQQTAKRVPELEAELERLRTTAQVPEEIDKELKELRMFRKVFDAQNDPEFQAQFDGRVKSLDDDLFGILRKNGLPEEVEKAMRDAGLDKVDPKFWEEQVLPNLSFVERERVQKRLAERADVLDQKASELEKFASQRDEVIGKREKEQMERFQQDTQAVEQHLENLTKDLPWARRIEVDKVPAADKAKAEAHNQNVDKLEMMFKESLYPTTPQARAEIAAAAVASTVLAQRVTAATAQIAALTAEKEKLAKELASIKSAARIPGGQPGGRAAKPVEVDRLSLRDDDAIEAGLQEAESGN